MFVHLGVWSCWDSSWGPECAACPCPGPALALQWLMAEGEVGFVPFFFPPEVSLLILLGFWLVGFSLFRRDEVLRGCESLLVAQQGLEVPWANVGGLL